MFPLGISAWFWQPWGHLGSPTLQAQPDTDGGGDAQQVLPVQAAAPGNDSLVPSSDSCSGEIRAESQRASARVEGRSITLPFDLRAGNSLDQVTPSSSEHLLLLI